MKICILTSPSGWCSDLVNRLSKYLESKNHIVHILSNHKFMSDNYDLCLLLSYYEIIPIEYIEKSTLTCCLHCSYLPKGRGCAPITWQILEGQNKIPLTLFEVVEEVDAGSILAQSEVNISNIDLLSDIRYKIEKEAYSIIVSTIDNNFQYRQKQDGISTYYGRRTPSDSELDINKSIREQINLLRSVDNDNYPAFFVYNGVKFILKIEHGD